MSTDNLSNGPSENKSTIESRVVKKLIRDACNELLNIIIEVTPEKFNKKIQPHRFNPHLYHHCIYGQIAGNCNSSAALKLIRKCATNIRYADGIFFEKKYQFTVDNRQPLHRYFYEDSIPFMCLTPLESAISYIDDKHYKNFAQAIINFSKSRVYTHEKRRSSQITALRRIFKKYINEKLYEPNISNVFSGFEPTDTSM